MAAQYNDGYGYEEPYYEPEPQPPPSSRHGNQSRAKYSRLQPEEYPQPSYSNGHSQAPPALTHQPASDPTPADMPLFRPIHKQPQNGVKGGDAERKPKEPPKRIIDDIQSPDSLGWDNPFPTFPAKPKNSQSAANSRRTSLEEDRRYRGQDGRPRTANSKGSHGSSRNEQNGVNPAGSQNGADPRSCGAPDPVQTYSSQTNSYEEPQSQPLRSKYNQSASGQSRLRDYAKPRNEQSDQLRPSGVRSPHSEDTFERPPIKVDSSVSGYERSQTMPTAIAEVAGDFGHPSGLVDQGGWEEPGAITGYYGPEDKNFLPTGSGTTPKQTNFGRPEVHVNGYTSTGSNPAAPQQASTHNANKSQDSVGDLFDTYYDPKPYEAPKPEVQPYRPSQQQRNRSAAEDDMPNFDAVSSSNPKRGMSFDDHLQPQMNPIVQQPSSAPYQGYDEGSQRPDQHHFKSSPRTKSQPDLHNPRSPRPPPNNGFNFNLPPSADGRPATSASSRAPGAYAPQSPVSDPRDRQRRPNPPARPQDYQPPMPRRGNSNDRQRPRDPYATSDPGAAGPDRYRSPPLQNGRPPDVRMQQPSNSKYPSPGSSRGPSSPPNKPPPNPDALPYHPAPVRPGLAEGGQRNQAPKPAPVRQYGNVSSPTQISNPTQPPKSSRDSGPLTRQDLERLQQRAAANPNDQALQLQMAKKLVEAAAVLTDERADLNARRVARERYYKDALRIVKKLSAIGYPEATFYLGDCYSLGTLGVTADIKEAFNLYQTAAKANHAQAAYRVAVCCEIGQEEGGGTKRDAVKAMQWYKRAATLGDIPAMYKMGIIQMKGLLGQPKNPKEAIVFLVRAAERADKENPHALHELVSHLQPSPSPQKKTCQFSTNVLQGLLYENPTPGDGITKDDATAKHYFTQSATLGYKFSQFRLGCCYEYGLLTCPVDARQSIAWYSKAAVQEEHQSELALSGWYLTGSEGSLQQSDTEAYLWARKAATAGLAKAEYAMGYFTEVGIGAKADLEDAKRWYWRAACEFLHPPYPSQGMLERGEKKGEKDADMG